MAHRHCTYTYETLWALGLAFQCCHSSGSRLLPGEHKSDLTTFLDIFASGCQPIQKYGGWACCFVNCGYCEGSLLSVSPANGEPEGNSPRKVDFSSKSWYPRVVASLFVKQRESIPQKLYRADPTRSLEIEYFRNVYFCAMLVTTQDERIYLSP